jgi:rare lipoprotein A
MRPFTRAARVPVMLAGLALASLTLPAGGSADEPSRQEGAGAAAVVAAPAPTRQRLNVRVGQAAMVAGWAGSQVAGRVVALQRRADRGWRTIDRVRASAEGRYRLTHVPRDATSERLRLRVKATGSRPAVRRGVGRMNAFRRAHASWYGPGLYGARTACGRTLTAGLVGVAHKSLPCGSHVTLRRGDRILRAEVVDRGPFVGSREFDLTAATRNALGFGSTGTVEVAV